MGVSVIRHAAMTLNRFPIALACCLVGCVTSPDPIREAEADLRATSHIRIERLSAPAERLLIGRPLASRDAPCDGFRTVSYSADAPETTKQLLCVSREELGTLYAPEPPLETDPPTISGQGAPSVTVFEIEAITPKLEIRRSEP